MKILVVEDEIAIREGLVSLLEGAGHEVEAAEDGAMGLQMGTKSVYDVVILDLMLPEIQGWEVCRQLRKVRPGVPILMLTALAAKNDIVRGLDAGADDYVTKPFSTEELLARVEAIGRRVRRLGMESEVICVDDCELDLAKCQVKRGPTTLSLTPREVGIIRWLYRHRGRVVTNKELLEEIWGVKSDLETNTVETTIANLRRKIERKSYKPKIIVTVKGLGYAWGADV